jgi:hypothetical protein
MNFGTIKDIFASQLVESQISGDEKGKNLYKKFIKLMTEDEILKSQFIVYKNIENKYFDSEVNASEYVKENISALKRYSIEDIEKSNKKLITLLESNGVELTPESYRKLHKSIHTLVSEEKSATNVNKIHESFETVKDWLMVEKTRQEKSDYVKEGVDPKVFLELVVEKYNEKYSELSEEEKEIVRVLREGDDSSMESLMKKLVKESVTLINNHLQEYGDNLGMKEKLLEAKDVIYGMVDNDDSFGEKVLKLLELKNNLS